MLSVILPLKRPVFICPSVIVFSFVLTLFSATGQLNAQPSIVPVADLNTSLWQDRVFSHCTHGGYDYYLINNGSVGYEFFASPVGSEDRKLLVDSVPGPSGTFSVNWFFRCNKFYNGSVYLAARTGENETTIYRSGGTPENTVVLGTIDRWVQIAPRVGKYLVYSKDTPGASFEPYSFNLETGEETFLGDLYPGPESSNPQWGSVGLEINGKLFFRARTAETGGEPFYTDGTPEGTGLLKDIYPGTQDSSPRSFVGLQGKAYFVARTQDEGSELWVTDGTEEGTELVRDFYPGSQGGVSNLQERDGFLYMTVTTPEFGSEPWISDGTADGSILLMDVVPGPTGSSPLFYRERLNGNLLFTARTDSTSNERTFYQTDGTPGGTSKLLENFDSIVKPFAPIVTTGSQVLFLGDTEGHGTEIWKTDGTDAGTMRLTDILPGPADGVSVVTEFETFGNSVLFLGGPSRDLRHYKISLDTFEVQDLGWQDPVTNQSSFPSGFFSIGSKFLFKASTAETGRELWISDGTEAGTERLTDAAEGVDDFLSSNASLQPFVQIGNFHYFIGRDQTHGRELWRTNGTTAGTTLVKDIYPGESNSVNTTDEQFSLVNGKLLFTADDGTHGRELWVSDGTESGTTLLKDIYPGPTSSVRTTRYWLVFNDRLYFAADTPDNDMELWVSDGTEAGTTLLKDIRPGTSGSFPKDFVAFQGKVYFSAFGPTNGQELWKTDGTEAGTELAEDIVAGADSSQAAPVYATDDYLLLRVNTPEFGYEPWVKTSENSAATLLKDTTPGTQGHFIQIDRRTEALNSILLFLVTTEETGAEVWRTDGTSAGTYLLRDINPGSNGSVGTPVPRVFDGKIYFGANDGTHGFEMWHSDGTSSGTKMLFDYFPGRGSGIGSLQSFLRFNGTAYFAAIDAIIARELVKFSDDLCPSDESKSHPGYCGCGNPDRDSDLDLVIECTGGCPNDPLKTMPGICGCDVVEADRNANGIIDCLFSSELNASLLALRQQLGKLKAKRSYKSKKAKAKEREIKSLVREYLQQLNDAQTLSVSSLGVSISQSKLSKLLRSARRAGKKALKNNSRAFGRNKKKARRALIKVMLQLSS